MYECMYVFLIIKIRVGISEEEMEEIHRKADQEKQFLMKQAQQDMKALIEQQSRTQQEREELQAKFAKEMEDRKAIEAQKKSLSEKLKVNLCVIIMEIKHVSVAYS